MNALWDAYWPAITFVLVVGAIAGSIAFRRPVRASRRTIALGIGIAGALAAVWLWHSLAGAGETFAAKVDTQARQVLVNYEMMQVRSRMQRSPLARTVILSGPADDFQRRELARIMELVPGVSRARWADARPPAGLPLLAEVELAGLAGFGLGLVLAYLLELRRRSRAQWRW